MRQSPAIEAFVAGLDDVTVFGQVRIERTGTGFTLTHEQDSSSDLESVALGELRQLADATATGNYRPLKSAPNLRTGWRCPVSSPAELEQALGQLYPGAVADWHAPKTGDNVTTYREYTARQTGMYRITAFPDDATTAEIIQACCPESLCLKKRHWDVTANHPPNGPKYSIPCLEPCPILLEFARKAVRMSQEKQSRIQVSESEIETLIAALGADSPASGEEHREADFADPRNSRVRELLKNKLTKARESLREQPEP